MKTPFSVIVVVYFNRQQISVPACFWLSSLRTLKRNAQICHDESVSLFSLTLLYSEIRAISCVKWWLSQAFDPKSLHFQTFYSTSLVSIKIMEFSIQLQKKFCISKRWHGSWLLNINSHAATPLIHSSLLPLSLCQRVLIKWGSHTLKMHLKHYLCSEQLSAAGISSVLITTAQREVSVRFRKEREREALHLIKALLFDKSVARLHWAHGRQHRTTGAAATYTH
jgi:hypothetical protein